MIVYRHDFNDCIRKNSQKQVFRNLQFNLFNTFNYDKHKEYIHFLDTKALYSNFLMMIMPKV